jgi:hypothetical protein
MYARPLKFFLGIQKYLIQLDPSDSTVSAEAGTEPWTVATFTLVLEALTTRLDLIHIYCCTTTAN